MAGMALYLSWVPCVAAFAFIGWFMTFCHRLEVDKLERERREDEQTADLATSASEFLGGVTSEDRERASV